MTSFEEFKRLSTGGNVIPVYESLLMDAETPVSVYLKIRDQNPYSFLLESVEGGEKLARYTFLGFDPFMSFIIRGTSYSIQTYHDDVRILPSLVEPNDHPLEALRKLFAHIRTVPVSGLPRFSGGAVGYFGYECVGLIENIPPVEDDSFQIPDAHLLFFDVVLVFDNVKREVILVSNAYLPQDDLPEEVLRAEYDKAVGKLERLKKLLRRVVPTERGGAVIGDGADFLISKDQYCEAVRRAQEYILEGDIFQVVLSQHVQQRVNVDSFDLYRSLRVINPSPYMYYLRIDDLAVVGSSPEMLVRVEGGWVETRPIAGTRRRGKTQDEDARLAEELLLDSKERSEHLMLVDLARNDLGRICEFGTIRVAESMRVERYSHVMHIVSSVTGKVRKDVSPIDALFACFPAGTLTGAPKIRAMEIIAELESTKRGIYGGAIAYLDFSGNLDSCIAIRTVVYKAGVLHFQAGAGVVHESKPEREFEETLEKLAATRQALIALTAQYPG